MEKGYDLSHQWKEHCYMDSRFCEIGMCNCGQICRNCNVPKGEQTSDKCPCSKPALDKKEPLNEENKLSHKWTNYCRDSRYCEMGCCDCTGQICSKCYVMKGEQKSDKCPTLDK